MNRPDITNKLIHLTKGDDDREALSNLTSMISQRTILGGTGEIKGGYKCVCLCETPLSHLAFVLADREGHQFKYRAFGLMFSKEFIYTKGGRPVIYGEDSQFEALPDEMRYRHVRFEPTRKPKPIDFTWEREWRILTDKLEFSPKDVTIVCPSRRYVEIAYDVFTAGEFRGQGDPKVPWHFAVLEDIGVEIPIQRNEPPPEAAITTGLTDH